MANEEIIMGIEKEEVKENEPKKSTFATWTVGNETYKLKLQAAEINELEKVYKKNLLLLLDEDDIPPLATMLTIIQAAMERWHHGMTFKKVQKLFDAYAEEGHSQTDLLKDVVIEIFKVSGFFTKEMSEMIDEQLEDEKQNS